MAIAFLSGVVNALHTPIRQSIISDLVPKQALLNAVALNSAQFQTSRTLGPALAGVIVALVGPGWCFFLNGLSFLAVIGALLAMKLPPLNPVGRGMSMGTNLVEGLRYARNNPTILALLGLATIPSFFGMPYNQLMPALAADVFFVDAKGLGLMMSAAGLGALVGALGVASLGLRAPRGMLMLGSIVSFGVCLSVLALSPSFPLALVALLGSGASAMGYSALNQSFLQTLSDDRMRGRVMSLLTVATFGMQPLGSLEAGTVAAAWGPQVAVLLGGIVCIAWALFTMALRPTIRRLS
jgi:MFS family permease